MVGIQRLVRRDWKGEKHEYSTTGYISIILCFNRRNYRFMPYDVNKEKSMIESSVAITGVICTAMLWLLLGLIIGYECGKYER